LWGFKEIYGKYLSDEAHEQIQLQFQIQQTFKSPAKFFLKIAFLKKQ